MQPDRTSGQISETNLASSDKHLSKQLLYTRLRLATILWWDKSLAEAANAGSKVPQTHFCSFSNLSKKKLGAPVWIHMQCCKVHL